MVTSTSLPSIAFLRAFARAAKTLNFKQAAADLHVSPSALSRRIQGLEDHLGVALFVRGNPGLELTDSGSRYLASVEDVLRILREASDAVMPSTSRPLRISTLESFSTKWLVPNLPSLKAEHPELEVEIEATLRYADFARDPVDVAIRFGTGPWGDLYSEPIVELEYIPVCCPALRDGPVPLRTPEDLVEHTWIHVRQVPTAWADWARSVGQPDLRPKQELSFDHVGIALSAAESGQGVAISSSLLCRAEIVAGRLCIPFDMPVRSSSTYHMVCRRENLSDPRIVAFRDWLLARLT